MYCQVTTARQLAELTSFGLVTLSASVVRMFWQQLVRCGPASSVCSVRWQQTTATSSQPCSSSQAWCCCSSSTAWAVTMSQSSRALTTRDLGLEGPGSGGLDNW